LISPRRVTRRRRGRLELVFVWRVVIVIAHVNLRLSLRVDRPKPSVPGPTVQPRPLTRTIPHSHFARAEETSNPSERASRLNSGGR
jgi:hypothetical protein